jgi:hypothetical protein
MPIFPIQYTRTLGTGGGTVNIDITDHITEYTYDGSGNLTSNWTIQPSATPTEPVLVRIFYNCTFALNGNTITIFGETLNVQQAILGNVLVEAIYDLVAAKWIVVVKESDSDLIPEVQGVTTTSVPFGSGTRTLVAGIDSVWQEITGNVTLMASQVVDGSSSAGYFYVHYTGTCTPNTTETLTIFGLTLTDSQLLLGNVLVFAYYDTINNVWRSQLISQPNDVNFTGTTTTDISAGSTITLTSQSKQTQVLTGTGALGGAVVVTSSGTFVDGQTFNILYQATTSAFSVTILGYLLTASQQLYGNVNVLATYDLANTTWILSVSQDPATAITDISEIIVIPVSFESGEQCGNIIRINYKFTITKAYYTVTKQLSGTDDGTITLYINIVPVTTGVLTIPASTNVDIQNSVNPSANNSGTAFDTISAVTQKTTVGGKALITLFIQRIP